MRGRALALGGCIVAASFGLFAGALAARPPDMSVTPSEHDFGTLCKGRSASTTFTIKNTQANSDALVISSIKRSGSDRFSPQSVPTPAPIPAEETADFSVTFTAPTH